MRPRARVPGALHVALGAALLVALGAALAGPAAAATRVVVASGGTRDELQAAVDALGGAGVVVIPPGEWECTGTVTISADDVTILGSGADQTRLFRSVDDPDDALKNAAFFVADGAARLRIAHLRIDGVAAASSDALDRGVYVVDGVDFRVDHVTLTHLGNCAVCTRGITRGVVDHARIADGYKAPIANYGYGVAVYGTQAYTGEPFGTAEAVFIEDNIVTGARHAVASNSGARYVFRHNHVAANENSQAVDAHGDEYNGDCPAGTEWVEVYENVIDDPVATNNAVLIRGGAGVVWGNRISGYAHAVALWENTPQPTGWIYIWGNTISSGTQLVTPATTDPTAGLEANGRPDFKLSAPAGYQAHTYPHPLVTDLDARAGPDVTVAGPAGEVWVDATGTTAAGGTVVAYRWLEGESVLSSCARDVLALPEGVHVLLLEGERSDGLLEHDTAVVRVAPVGPLASTSSWASRWFVPVVGGSGSARFTLTPGAAPQDAYVTLAARTPVGAHEDSAILVRTATSGRFDVRDGDAYRADAVVPYVAGQAYDVVVTFDLVAQRYSVTIDGAAVATDYAFRASATEIGQLTAWHSSGSLLVDAVEIAGERALPDPACLPAPPLDAGLADAAGAFDAGGPGPIVDGATTPGEGDEVAGGCGCRTGRADRPPAGGDSRGLPGDAVICLALGILLTLARRAPSRPGRPVACVRRSIAARRAAT